MGFTITKDGTDSVEVPQDTGLEDICDLIFNAALCCNCVLAEDPPCDLETSGLIEPLIFSALAAGGIVLEQGSGSQGA